MNEIAIYIIFKLMFIMKVIIINNIINLSNLKFNFIFLVCQVC